VVVAKKPTADSAADAMHSIHSELLVAAGSRL
jgi:hypothetical protein